MAAGQQPTHLPTLPVPTADFLSGCIEKHAGTNPRELLPPYLEYESKLRQVFAQEPSHPAISDNTCNLVPVFDGHQAALRTHARDLQAETQSQTDKYLMPLKKSERRANGSPAVVQSIKDFRQNFSTFTENSLADLDWSNVVAAGSSVLTPLLPVPKKYSKSRKAQREWYHEKLAPASDVDLFLYGLTEEQAIEKIKHIQRAVSDAILHETTAIRTKHTITIASRYPTRHVQIVLRIYKSISEILTGFDVDCSCVAYDGKQVYASPRAVASLMTQCNAIDLSRRSPSYENRLSKYARRGFEAYWDPLDRSRIDPSIYERAFNRVVGLARILVLEKLPDVSDRENYVNERRIERRRPTKNTGSSARPTSLPGNYKDDAIYEIAEWDQEEGNDISNYHSFTIPYGPTYHAKKIERILYTKDMLLNSEWNKPDDREVNLHRHPAFVGDIVEIMEDCCGLCPEARTDEEIEVAEMESKIFIKGAVTFIQDDPGRQSIGSFNPLTEDDWTDMAYISPIEELCQAIASRDASYVWDWCQKEENNVNFRHFTGITPLQMATMSSSPEIVKILIDAGARLVSRTAEGSSALHMAAARGGPEGLEALRLILRKSEENEEREAEKDSSRRRSKRQKVQKDSPSAEKPDSDDDVEMVDVVTDDTGDVMDTASESSYVAVKDKDDESNEKDDELQPDVYDVNLVGWDSQASPLHYAILHNNVEIVEELISNFGADILIPVKTTPPLLNLVLSDRLPSGQAKDMAELLLRLGASIAQGDQDGITALHRLMSDNSAVLKILLSDNSAVVPRIIDHLVNSKNFSRGHVSNPLISGVMNGQSTAIKALLAKGALPYVRYETWLKVISKRKRANHGVLEPYKDKRDAFNIYVEQPIVAAVRMEKLDIAKMLLEAGADPNVLTHDTYFSMHALMDEHGSHWTRERAVHRDTPMQSLLDLVKDRKKQLSDYKGESYDGKKPKPLKEDGHYLKDVPAEGYSGWRIKSELARAKARYENENRKYELGKKFDSQKKGQPEKTAEVNARAKEFADFESLLLEKGAKAFKDTHSEVLMELEKKKKEPDSNRYRRHQHHSSTDKDDTAKEPKFEFGVSKHDITEQGRRGYNQLFEAAWAGEGSKIEELTTAMWGEKGDQDPLILTVQDNAAMTPFAIALMRGNFETAQSILKIAEAQYHPNDPENEEDSDEDEEEEELASEDMDNSDEDVEEEPSLKKRPGNKPLTIDVIEQLGRKVRNTIRPDYFLNNSYAKVLLQGMKTGQPDFAPVGKSVERMTLLEFAISTNDEPLFRFLLKATKEHDLPQRLESMAKAEGLGGEMYSGPFMQAIKLGRVSMLRELIRELGAGAPWAHLTRWAKVEIPRDSEYYLGLKCHGQRRKPRADGLNFGGDPSQRAYHQDSPIATAISASSLDSIEFILSETPQRLYAEFAREQSEKHIKALASKSGMLEKSLNSWFTNTGIGSGNVALHLAILAESTNSSQRILEYLVRTQNDLLETKSATGYTPLHTAFAHRRMDAVKLLLKAGANQTCRNRDGQNILHSLLITAGSALNSKDAAKRLERVKSLIDLIDQRLLSTLWCEISESGLTPLTQWLLTFPDGKDRNTSVDFLRFLFTKGADKALERVSGAGDLPLHIMVKKDLTRLIQLIAETHPALFFRENSIGMTPVELARSFYLNRQLSPPNQVQPALGNSLYPGNITRTETRDVSSFAPSKPQKSEPANYGPIAQTIESYASLQSFERTWRICEAVASSPRCKDLKRRLVTLNEANAVSDRLAARERARHTQRKIDFPLAESENYGRCPQDYVSMAWSADVDQVDPEDIEDPAEKEGKEFKLLFESRVDDGYLDYWEVNRMTSGPFVTS